MYRIQAYNYVKNYHRVYNCETMNQRDQYIQSLLDSKEYVKAGISAVWLARY